MSRTTGCVYNPAGPKGMNPFSKFNWIPRWIKQEWRKTDVCLPTLHMFSECGSPLPYVSPHRGLDLMQATEHRYPTRTARLLVSFKHPPFPIEIESGDRTSLHVL